MKKKPEPKKGPPPGMKKKPGPPDMKKKRSETKEPATTSSVGQLEQQKRRDAYIKAVMTKAAHRMYSRLMAGAWDGWRWRISEQIRVRSLARRALLRVQQQETSQVFLPWLAAARAKQHADEAKQHADAEASRQAITDTALALDTNDLLEELESRNLSMLETKVRKLEESQMRIAGDVRKELQGMFSERVKVLEDTVSEAVEKHSAELTRISSLCGLLERTMADVVRSLDRKITDVYAKFSEKVAVQDKRIDGDHAHLQETCSALERMLEAELADVVAMVADKATELDQKFREKNATQDEALQEQVAELSSVRTRLETRFSQDDARADELWSTVEELCASRRTDNVREYFNEMCANLLLEFSDASAGLDKTGTGKHTSEGDADRLGKLCRTLDQKVTEASAELDERLTDLHTRLALHEQSTAKVSALDDKFTKLNFEIDTKYVDAHRVLDKDLRELCAAQAEVLHINVDRLTEVCGQLDQKFTDVSAEVDERFTDNLSKHQSQLDVVTETCISLDKKFTDICCGMDQDNHVVMETLKKTCISLDKKFTDICGGMDQMFTEKCHAQDSRIDDLSGQISENYIQQSTQFSAQFSAVEKHVVEELRRIDSQTDLMDQRFTEKCHAQDSQMDDFSALIEDHRQYFSTVLTKLERKVTEDTASLDQRMMEQTVNQNERLDEITTTVGEHHDHFSSLLFTFTKDIALLDQKMMTDKETAIQTCRLEIGGRVDKLWSTVLKISKKSTALNDKILEMASAQNRRYTRLETTFVDNHEHLMTWLDTRSKLTQLQPRPLSDTETTELLRWLFTDEAQLLDKMPAERRAFLECVGLPVIDARDSDHEGRTGLMRALVAQRYELAREMVAVGADPLVEDERGMNMAGYAMQLELPERAEFLEIYTRSKLTDVKQRLLSDTDAMELLRWLFTDEAQHLENMPVERRAFLECVGLSVIDVRDSDHEGRTGLMRALVAQRYELAREMVAVGADPRLKDKRGANSEDLAMGIVDAQVRAEMVALCKKAVEEFGCFRIISDGVEMLYVFEEDLLVHTSKTCHVTRVIELKTNRKYVLKFMREKAQWDTELQMRDFGTDAGQPLSEGCVVQILHSSIMTPQELAVQADACRRRTPKAGAIRNFGCHLLVMERGERDLADIIAHDLIAGVELKQVKSIGRSMAECLLNLEKQKKIHGDGKPRNAMEFRQPLRTIFGSIQAWLQDLEMSELVQEFESAGVQSFDDVDSMEDSTMEKLIEASTSKHLKNAYLLESDMVQKARPNQMMMIDLDASAYHGELAGKKWSSAYAPPELAALIYEYGMLPDDSAKPEWVQYLEQQQAANQVRASPTFDAWSFGMVLYSLAAPEGAMPFLVSATDNIVRREELRRLAYEWEEHKLTKVSKLVWPAAQDLVLWCLQTVASRRPQSFQTILDHPFFGGPATFHCLRDAKDDLSNATKRHANELHAAIQEGDIDIVRRLFDMGCVHYNLLGQVAGTGDERPCLPLQRAAYHGDVEIVQILLNEINDAWPADVKARVLDSRTALGYTAFMLASECEHTEIARMLKDAGCTTSLQNELGKTGADLAAAAELEHAQAEITPFKHGAAMHRHCETIAQYLDLRKLTQNEHIAAGLQIWHAKQFVGHFSLEEIEQFTLAILGQTKQMHDVALHFTDLDSARLITHSLGIRASTEGQLGGGVSVCLETLAGFGWKAGKDGVSFAKAIGKALWGSIFSSKWYEVVPMSEKPADGSPDASPHFGKWAKKLECVFMISVPSAERRDPTRSLPGRKHVYIIPQGDCIPGKFLNEGDSNTYLSNTHVLALLLLQQPAQVDLSASRVQVTSKRDIYEGMTDIAMNRVDMYQRSADVLDRSSGFPPKVLQFTATIAKTVKQHELDLRFYRMLEAEHKDKRLWPENISRFTDKEMKAGLDGVKQELLHSHVLAFFFTTNERAEVMCQNGRGIAAQRDGSSSTYSLTLGLVRPYTLGWRPGATGLFKRNVAGLLGIEQDDVQTMIVLSMPAHSLPARGFDQRTLTISEQIDQLELLSAYGTQEHVVLANAHVQKMYQLEPPDIVEARQNLAKAHPQADFDSWREELASRLETHEQLAGASEIDVVVGQELISHKLERIEYKRTPGAFDARSGVVAEAVPPIATMSKSVQIVAKAQDDEVMWHKLAELVAKDEKMAQLKAELVDKDDRLAHLEALLRSD